MSIKIIAEAGVNHNGDLGLALNLVDEAKKAGADYVKFQRFRADDVACLLYTSPSPRDLYRSRMPSSA